MKKYKARISLFFTPKITPVKCERETESSVWINGRRRTKMTDYDCYFDTFIEAKAYLLSRAEERIKAIQNNLKSAYQNHEQIKNLKETDAGHTE